MVAYVPGKRPEDLDPEAVREFVKLSANEWSGEPFPEVLTAVAEAARGLNRYPEDPAHLRGLIGDVHGVAADNVMLGPGSNTLLYWTALAAAGPGDEVVYPTPSFALYSLTVALAGATPVPIDLCDLRLDLDAMAAAVTPDTRLVFVCNPNNPSSTGLAGERVAAFVDRLDPSIVVAVDEAYAEFGSAPGFGSAIPLIAANDNIVVYRTFSKIYGLAGARLGYAMGHPDTLRSIAKAGVPFSASTPAVAAASAAILATGRVEARRRHVMAERSRVTAALRERGFVVADSEANFVYLAVADEAEHGLEDAGVIVRRYGAGWIRVTIGSSAENDAFLAAIGGSAAS
jgi:histidinol-phosphate aminotransferase